MFIMWFSGLRGAISYALSLHLDFSDETRHVIITTTLIIVLFTTLIFGGSTMPLLKFLRAEKKQKNSNSRRKKKDKEVSLSKTREWVIRKILITARAHARVYEFTLVYEHVIRNNI